MPETPTGIQHPLLFTDILVDQATRAYRRVVAKWTIFRIQADILDAHRYATCPVTESIYKFIVGLPGNHCDQCGLYLGDLEAQITELERMCKMYSNQAENELRAVPAHITATIQAFMVKQVAP